MRVSATILGFVAATCLTLSPAFAQGKGHGAGSAKPHTSVKPVTSGKPAGPTTHSTGKPTTSGKSVTQTGKPTTSGKPPKTTTTSTGKPTTSGKPAKSSGKPTSTTTTTTTVTSNSGPGSKSKGSTSTTPSTTTVAGSTSTPLNPIAAKIASKPNLSAKLTRMLPIDPLTGMTMTLDKASLGFKNQGQFIAALHVSENLGIPFATLKSHMVTVTPGVAGQPATATQTGSLGQAIQASKTTTNVTAAVNTAEAQAAADLQSAGLTSTTTTTTTTTKKNGKGQ